MQLSDPDDLFDRPAGPVKPFAFDAEVARVFPDMVRRSVPGYAELVGLSGLIARRFARPGTRCYDLGCSLGAVTAELLRQTTDEVEILAVDRAEAMIAGLRARLAASERLRVCCADLEEVAIERASVIVMNLTLQFVAPERRASLLARIRAGLVPGGALILAEKVAVGDDPADRLLVALHEDFKRAQGYSELAISRKRAALERVLIPDRLEVHEQRLAEAGFTHVVRWFSALNFVAWVAWT